MNLDQTLGVFRAAGEETRLRILTLLSNGELTVTELTQILGQSQPRVSRHLKVLNDAGLVERYREGSWVFYRLGEAGASPSVASVLSDTLRRLAASGDRIVARDAERLKLARRARAEAAADYFNKSAAKWDDMRKLHLPESDIEATMLSAAGPQNVSVFLDLGTGTGRLLEIFAGIYEKGVGYDLSLEMLAVARANLERAGVSHAQVRQGDIFAMPLEDGAADFISIHQVLHYVADAGAAVAEAARLLSPGGRLMIVDFAPHDLEFLREDHAHRRLGFSDEEVRAWCEGAGLNLARVDTLSPDKTGVEGRLTVKIWLCADARGRSAASRKKETAA
ncbi:MAG: metalloregulator ArsR/SmtB family transcription factor [Pseudomonadota bacterium]